MEEKNSRRSNEHSDSVHLRESNRNSRCTFNNPDQTYCNTRVYIVDQTIDCVDAAEAAAAAVAAVVDDDGDDNGADGDGDVVDVMRRNRFRCKVYHQRRSCIEVRMDRTVRLRQQIMVDHCSVVYNTSHRNHHPKRSSPFDAIVVPTDLQ